MAPYGSHEVEIWYIDPVDEPGFAVFFVVGSCLLQMLFCLIKITLLYS